MKSGAIKSLVAALATGIVIGGCHMLSKDSNLILQGDLNGKHYEFYGYTFGGKRTEITKSDGTKIRYFDNRGCDRQTEAIPFLTPDYSRLTDKRWTNEWHQQFGFVDLIEIYNTNGTKRIFENARSWGQGKKDANGEYQELFEQATKEVKSTVKEILYQKTGIRSQTERDKSTIDVKEAREALK